MRDVLDDLVITAQREGLLLVLVRCGGSVTETARVLHRDRSGVYQIMRRTRITRALIMERCQAAQATRG